MYLAYYLLKVVILSAVLFLYYRLFLRNKVFHHYNRFYLLAVVALSPILPLLQVNFWEPVATARPVAFTLLQVVDKSDDMLDEIVLYSSYYGFHWQLIAWAAVALITLGMLLMLLRSLRIIHLLKKHNPSMLLEGVNLIFTNDKSTPFSFFKNIFWNNSINMNDDNGQMILRHELVHVHEKHSYDKLFLNAIMVLFWSNPVFWLIRHELNMIHEFIADQKSVKEGDSAALAKMILASAYPAQYNTLTNAFFYSPIKRRIAMIKKQFSNPGVGYAGRVLALPLAALLFVAFTFKTKKVPLERLPANKKITVVIDAGHGGDDNGATAINGAMEKDVNLSLAQAVAAANTDPNLQIILTRNSDEHQTVQQKADFANQANADLFISIHADITNVEEESKSGSSFWVAKDNFENASESKILASAMIHSFKESYGLGLSAPQPMQREKGIWVLQASKSPAVLIQAGMLNNKKDVSYLTSASGKLSFAECVLKGIRNYLLNADRTFKELSLKSSTENLSDSTPLIIIGDKIVPIQDLKGKKIYAETADFYKANDPIMIKKYGENARKDCIVLTNVKLSNSDNQDAYEILSNKATIHADYTKKNVNIEDYKSYTIFINGEKKNFNYLMSLDPNTFENIQTYKAGEISIYGQKVKGNVLDIITKSKKNNYQSAPSKLNTKSNREEGLLISANELLSVGDLAKINISGPADFKNDYVIGSDNSIYPKAFGKIFIAGLKPTEATKLIKEKFMEKLPSNSQITVTFYKKIEISPDENKIFTKVEEEAQFPGGLENWKMYLQQNLKPGTPVKNNAPPNVYQVIIQFIVHIDGSISDVRAVTSHGYGMEEECIRIIKNSPKWIPAMQNGKKVNSYRKQPITFVVQKNE